MESLRAKLKAATMDSHTKIEANPTLAKLTSRDLTESDYRSILEGYYGFFDALESEFAASAAHSQVPHFHERLRSARLKSDLQSLGLSDSQIANLPRCTRLPSVKSESEFLGTMYVTEGSTLGGMLIAKHLQTMPFFSPDRGSFFVSNPQEVSSRWKAFIDHLEARSPSLDEAATLSAATATFTKLDEWMDARVRCPDV